MKGPWFLILYFVIFIELSDPVDVYSDWVDAAETVKPDDVRHLNVSPGIGSDVEEEEESSHRIPRMVSTGGRSPDYGDEEDYDDF